MNTSLEQVYREHHAKRRGECFLVNGNARGAFLAASVGTGKTVLDIGCRDGALTSFYVSGNTVTGIDIDSFALEKARIELGIKTINADLNGTWPVSGLYDTVVACEVIEHLYYPDQVLSKIFNLLRPGGVLLGSIPHTFSYQSRLRLLSGIKKGTPLHDPTHINHFWGPEFKTLVEDAGFKNVILTGIYSKKFKWISGIFPNAFAHSYVFSAKKPG